MRTFGFIYVICAVLCFSFSKASSLELLNGSPVLYEKNQDIPRSIFVLNFEGGPSFLSKDEQGIVLLLEETLRSGPSHLKKDEFNKMLFRLGIDFEFVHGSNFFQIVVKAPTEEVNSALSLLNATLSSPRISEDEFNGFFESTKANLTGKFEDMRHTIFYFALRDSLTYSPYALTGDTSPEGLKNISYTKFKTNFQKLIDFSKMSLSYLGRFDSKVVISKLNGQFSERLSSSKYVKSKTVPKVVLKKTNKTIVLIDKPGATDNQLAFVFFNDVKRDSVDFLKAKLTMDLLGGGLHGQLSKTLRTERGLTYAAISRFGGANLPVWMVWTFGGDVQTKGLLTGVPEILKEFKKLRFSTLDFEEAKERLANEYLIENELAKDRLFERLWYANNHLNFKFHKDYLKNLESVSTVGTRDFLTHLQTDSPLIYLMGDREKLLKTIAEVGMSQDLVEVVSIKDIL